MAVDPLDMSPDELQGRLINAGLRSARQVGTGLFLVNELREQFPDVPIETIGQAVTTIGQGIAAAQIASQPPGSAPVDLDILPVLPSTFFTGDEIERVKAFADVSYQTIDENNPAGIQPDKTWDVRVNCGEGITFDELIDCIESHFEQFQEESPDFPTQKLVNIQIGIYFAGKRF